MNIVILSTSKAASGGVERFSFYLRDAYERAGHLVTILAKEDVQGFSKMLLEWSRFVGMQQPFLGWLLGRAAALRGFDACVTNGMLGWNLENKNIINVQHGTFARAAVRIDKGRNFFKYLVKFYVWGSFEGIAARRAKACVAVSEETGESVERYYKAKKVRVIPNAVDTELFKPRDKNESRMHAGLPLDKKVIVFDGRFEYAKGLPIIQGFLDRLESLNAHMVIAVHPDAHTVATYPVTMRIFSQEELSVIYSAADVFLLPSLHEGSSYALLQAISTGLPFLASPVGLIPELERQGLFKECVVHKQSIQEYVAGFRRLESLDEPMQKALQKRLRAYACEHHSFEAFAASYVSLLESL